MDKYCSEIDFTNINLYENEILKNYVEILESRIEELLHTIEEKDILIEQSQVSSKQAFSSQVSSINLNKEKEKIRQVIYDGGDDDIPNVTINPNFDIFDVPNDPDITTLTLINYPNENMPNLVNLVKLTIKGWSKFIIPDNLVNLEILEINDYDRHPAQIPNTLIKLKELKYEGYSDQSISIPDTLINLEKITYDAYEELVLPNTLINLKEINYINSYIDLVIPHTLVNLKTIKYYSKYLVIPNTLINLETINYICYELMQNNFILPNTLINLKHLIYKCDSLLVIPDTLTKLVDIDVFNCTDIELSRKAYPEVDLIIPNTLVSLESLSIKNYINFRLPNTLINLKKLCLEHTEISYIPEEYKNLTSLTCGKLFHKVLPKCEYTNNQYPKSVFDKLYNTLIKIQRFVRLLQFQNKKSLLYSPMYVGGYYGKKRLSKLLEPNGKKRLSKLLEPNGKKRLSKILI